GGERAWRHQAGGFPGRRSGDRESDARLADCGTAVDPRHQAWRGREERRVFRRYPLPSQWHRTLYTEGTEARRIEDHVHAQRRLLAERLAEVGVPDGEGDRWTE